MNGKTLHAGGKPVQPTPPGELSSSRHLLLVAFLVLGVVFVGHLLTEKQPSESFSAHSIVFFDD